jgi:hypothetical protein
VKSTGRIGSIGRAQAFAQKFKKDPEVASEVERLLAKKEEPKEPAKKGKR